MSTSSTSRPPRRSVVQPALIRLYKLVGIAALSAILVGLVLFVVVNVFYFFSDTWVRPVILTTAHPKVVQTMEQLDTSRDRLASLRAREVELRARIAETDREATAAAKFLIDAAGALPAELKTPDQLLARREIDRAQLEQANAAAAKAALEQQLSVVAQEVVEQQAALERLTATPFARALSQPVTVAFVPYDNLTNVQPNTSLYGCAWGLIHCSYVGKVVRPLLGEVQEPHPHSDDLERGVLVEIELSSPAAAEENVLFAGGKPFFVF